ncbi:helix-turn-helix domain-containing protein [Streptomyces sp. NPDC126514]|uniref:helix-turn-helix domain-containing protein n=1 Tax=Streptomyces sp. NPDC126514 TaxID=3155210 RepID=UPI00332D3845
MFRYQLIREAADAALSPRQRGAMVRAIAAQVHTDPFGKPVKITRGTVDRWLKLWREGGFDALLPPTRQVTPRTPEEVLDLAGRTEAGESDQVDRAGGTDPAAASGLGSVLSHGPPAPSAAGTADPPGRAGAGGIRPVRGVPPERTLGGRCSPWPQNRRP